MFVASIPSISGAKFEEFKLMCMFLFVYICSVDIAELSGLLPRLYPFLSHNIAFVREAALDTMVTLLTRYNKQVGKLV